MPEKFIRLYTRDESIPMMMEMGKSQIMMMKKISMELGRNKLHVMFFSSLQCLYMLAPSSHIYKLCFV